MNEGGYINSGVLEDYCLGLLSAEEETKVEAVCYEYPKVAVELQNLRKALEEYVGSNKILQREELRRHVWAAVKKIWEAKGS